MQIKIDATRRSNSAGPICRRKARRTLPTLQSSKCQEQRSHSSTHVRMNHFTRLLLNRPIYKYTYLIITIFVPCPPSFYQQQHRRIFASLVAGITTGLLGITGYKGFLLFVCSQILVILFTHSNKYYCILLVNQYIPSQNSSILYFATHYLLLIPCLQNAIMLILVSGFNPSKYYTNATSVFLSGLVSQTELLTFVLFWTLSNNLVYLY